MKSWSSETWRGGRGKIRENHQQWIRCQNVRKGFSYMKISLWERNIRRKGFKYILKMRSTRTIEENFHHPAVRWGSPPGAQPAAPCAGSSKSHLRPHRPQSFGDIPGTHFFTWITKGKTVPQNKRKCTKNTSTTKCLWCVSELWEYKRKCYRWCQRAPSTCWSASLTGRPGLVEKIKYFIAMSLNN